MPTNSVWFGLVEWRLVCFIRCLLVEITQSAQGLVAGAVGGGRAHDDVVAQFHFQKLAGADEIAGVRRSSSPQSPGRACCSCGRYVYRMSPANSTTGTVRPWRRLSWLWRVGSACLQICHWVAT